VKLTVVGATGGIGRLICGQALAAGHDVTAVLRDPAAAPPGVRPVVADLATAGTDALVPAVQGADAVLSALGPRSAADIGIVAAGTRSVVAAMGVAGTRRLVAVSAAPIGTVPSPGRPHPPRHDPGDGIVLRNVLNPLVKRLLRANYADLALMEDVVRDSDLDWTLVRPPRLTDGPRSGRYRTAYDANVRRGLSVSRADVADLMLALVDRPDSVRRSVGVAKVLMG
jgi:putative NADH-flavin reductase